MAYIYSDPNQNLYYEIMRKHTCIYQDLYDVYMSFLLGNKKRTVSIPLLDGHNFEFEICKYNTISNKHPIYENLDKLKLLQKKIWSKNIEGEDELDFEEDWSSFNYKLGTGLILLGKKKYYINF